MTGRDRILSILKCEKVDRVPNCEVGAWPQTLMRWRGEGLAFPVQRRWTLGEPFFRLEPFIAAADVDLLPIPRFDAEIFEETDRYIVSRDPKHGYITKSLKEGLLDDNRLSMDTYLDFPVKDRDSFLVHKRRFDPELPERYSFAGGSKTAGDWITRDLVVCPFPMGSSGPSGFYSLLRQWLGTVNTSFAFYDQPDLVHEILDFWLDFLLKILENLTGSIRFDVFHFFEDFAGKAGPLFSPRIFQEFLAPRYRELISYVKNRGIGVITFDSDGNLEALLPELLECGINVIMPNEVAAGMDPLELRRKFGDAFAMTGGIDKRVLPKGKEAIRRELDTKLPRLIDSGGFIPLIDHSVPPDISLDSFLTYLEMKIQYLG